MIVFSLVGIPSDVCSAAGRSAGRGRLVAIQPPGRQASGLPLGSVQLPLSRCSANNRTISVIVQPCSRSELKHLAAANALHAHHGARRGLAGQSVAARTTDRDPHFAAQSRACRSPRHQRHRPLFTESPVSPACPHGFPGLPVQARQPSHRQRSGRIRVPVGKERPHRPERPIRISRNAISPAGPPTSRTARSPSFVTR